MKKCIIRAMAISGEERKEEGGEKKGKKNRLRDRRNSRNEEITDRSSVLPTKRKKR